MRDFLAVARAVFPEASEEELLTYLWSYTGFPVFFDGEPLDQCRQQLVAARDGMAAGLTFDMERGWVQPEAEVTK